MHNLSVDVFLIWSLGLYNLNKLSNPPFFYPIIFYSIPINGDNLFLNIGDDYINWFNISPTSSSYYLNFIDYVSIFKPFFIFLIGLDYGNIYFNNSFTFVNIFYDFISHIHTNILNNKFIDNNDKITKGTPFTINWFLTNA